MKQVRALVLLLAVAGCVFLAYRLSHSPENSGNPSSPQADTQCDQGLWQYVYHPARLPVLAPCISVTGVVDEVRKESDGSQIGTVVVEIFEEPTTHAVNVKELIDWLKHPGRFPRDETRKKKLRALVE